MTDLNSKLAAVNARIAEIVVEMAETDSRTLAHYNLGKTLKTLRARKGSLEMSIRVRSDHEGTTNYID